MFWEFYIGAFRISPKKSLEIQAQIPPRELGWEKLSLQYAFKGHLKSSKIWKNTLLVRDKIKETIMFLKYARNLMECWNILLGYIKNNSCFFMEKFLFFLFFSCFFAVFHSCFFLFFCKQSVGGLLWVFVVCMYLCMYVCMHVCICMCVFLLFGHK